jgi:hypothetical protein
VWRGLHVICQKGTVLTRYIWIDSRFHSAFPSDDPQLIRKILQTVPRILRKNVQTSLEPTVQFLLQLYGQDLFEEAISRNPLLLLTSGVEVGPDNKELQIYLEEKLGMSRAGVMRLQQKAPSLFRMSLAKIEPIVDYFLELLKSGDFDESESKRIVRKLMSTYPYLMALSLKDNLRPRIEFLKERCGLSDGQVGSLFKSNASILGLSVSENLQPTLDFLSELLRQPRMSDKDLLGLVQKSIMGNPSMLASSLKNLQSKVKYFDAIDRLALDRDEVFDSDTTSLAARVAMRAPVVFSLSLKENIVPTVEFLGKIWAAPFPAVKWTGESFEILDGQYVSFDDNEHSWSLSSMLKEHPAVLSLSLEGNIQPTMNFYNRTGYTLLDSDWNLQLDRQPIKKGTSASPIRGRDISVSLFNRLLPRWQYWLANQSVDDQTGSSEMPAFYLLAGVTDQAFCERLGFDYDDYMKFKEESVPRLKFSSQFDTWVKTGRPIDESLPRYY